MSVLLKKKPWRGLHFCFSLSELQNFSRILRKSQWGLAMRFHANMHSCPLFIFITEKAYGKLNNKHRQSELALSQLMTSMSSCVTLFWKVVGHKDDLPLGSVKSIPNNTLINYFCNNTLGKCIIMGRSLTGYSTFWLQLLQYIVHFPKCVRRQGDYSGKDTWLF